MGDTHTVDPRYKHVIGRSTLILITNIYENECRYMAIYPKYPVQQVLMNSSNLLCLRWELSAICAPSIRPRSL